DTAYDEEPFSRSGYSGEKVTVDFYQTGLHNVFRIIGEVSGRNIIVAEGVSGTLTLSLNEVPWDFMLDIILNLKNLNKEEQFNTIIISPADKKFEWPGQGDKEDLVVSRPSPVVSKEAEDTRGKMEEAQLLRRAKKAEQAGNTKEALSYYEKVFKLDPERGDVAARITRLALTKLELNAKAAHYGRIACRLKPEEKELALLTATAYARIGKPKEAVEYYEIATSGAQPSEQALKGYAAFSEKYNSHRMALRLWEKYEEIYGASLETMVSRARILDLLGKKEKATEIYRRLKLSGYEIPSDLAEYIDNRVGNRGDFTKDD
ncbi:MAG: energy transducer TonB, partial [Desulfobia sp.]